MTRHRQFPKLTNDLILRAARGEPTERVPVWVMRQAGRYLPEFRASREKADFFTMCRTPELACEVTLQPIERFPLDAAIIFSDILVIPQALGMEVQMLPSKGPHFPQPLNTVEDFAKLDFTSNVDERLDYVYQAISLTRTKLAGKVPLIGFCGAPWTLLAYMIEGGSSKTFAKAKTWLYNHPEECSAVLGKMASYCARYLIGQVRHGAQMLQVFDSWAGELSPHLFDKFCLPFITQIRQEVRKGLEEEQLEQVPMIIFAKGAHFAIGSLADTGYEVISVDWTVNLAGARLQSGGRVTLQGNLDPCALFARPDVIRSEVRHMLERSGTQMYIANLGHGMMPEHDPEHLRVFIEAVHEISTEMNKAAAALSQEEPQHVDKRRKSSH